MTTAKPLRRIALGMLCVLAATSIAWAQETRATVTGTVKDGQGAFVPGATVTVLNTDTNVSYEGMTNDAGVFTVQRVQPGPVRISATLPGFKTSVREGVTLRT